MRWILGAAALVGAIWLLISKQELTPAHEAPSPAVITPQEAPLSEFPAEETVVTAQPAEAVPKQAAPDRDDNGVINIGEPMDPDDPSTWPVDENTEVINIGESMDLDDPSTWLQPEDTEIINIGEPMDPGDPYTWSKDGR